MIVFFTARWLKRIPGVLPGILFLCLAQSVCGQSLELASELWAEGNWVGARREALRTLAMQPENERALLMAAMAGSQLDPAPLQSAAETVLSHLADQAAEREVRQQAGYAFARSRWRAGDLTQAWTAYAGVFREASNRDLFLHSGCALFLLRQQQPDLGFADPALLNQLATCRDLWSWELRDEVRVSGPKNEARLTAKPGEWIVRFYRSQIGPAIGHRCSLQPGCSAYFLEASRKHGLLGVPLIADRLVREPGVVSAAERPVVTGEEIRFQDPLKDHLHE